MAELNDEIARWSNFNS